MSHDPNLDYENPSSPSPGDADLGKALQIDPANLDAEFLKQPGLTYFYGELEVHAEFAYDEAKTRHEVLCAQIYEEKRRSHELSGQRISKATLDGLVALDERSKASTQILRDALKNKRMAKVAFQSIRDRMSVLISVGANQRAQFDAEPFTKSSSGWNSGPVRVDEAMVPGRFGKRS